MADADTTIPKVEEPENEFAADLAAAFAADEEAANGAPEGDKPADGGEGDKPKEGEEGDDAANPKDPKKPDEGTPPAGEAEKPKDGAAAAEDPKAPGEEEAPVAPQPLTKEDAASIFNNIRAEERASSKELETTTNEVLEAYYPDGLSNVLVDEASGKELKTPQDVVDASGGNMTTEQAAQWLMNEQFKLDQSVTQIKNDAQKIAETTINFKRDSMTVLHKYEPLFKAYPQLQKKTFDKLMKQVKADEKKGVILSAPDVTEFYDDLLEPYQQAYEFSTKQSATNPTPPAKGTPAAPEVPVTPGQGDRMDEGGDGGATTDVDDPNDFAQQVAKELSKPL